MSFSIHSKFPFIYPSGAPSLLLQFGKEWDSNDIAHRQDWAIVHGDFYNLSAGARAVLFFLAFRWTVKNGCYPSVESIAKYTGLAPSTTKNHLSYLKKKSIIASQRRSGKFGHKKSNIYILGFENRKIATEPKGQILDIGETSRAKKQASLEPKNSSSYSQNLAPNRQYNNIQDEVHAAKAAHDGFLEFFNTYPRHGDRSKTLASYQAAISSGPSHDQLMFALRKYCEKNSENIRSKMLQYIKLPHLWLTERYYDRYPLPSVESVELVCGINPLTVQAIRDGKAFLCRQVGRSTAAALVAGNHVTPEQCRAAGVCI